MHKFSPSISTLLPILQVPGYEVSNRVHYFQQGVPQQNIRLIKQQLWIPVGGRGKEKRNMLKSLNITTNEAQLNVCQAHQDDTWAQIIITKYSALIASLIVGEVECLPKTKHVLHPIDGPVIT